MDQTLPDPYASVPSNCVLWRFDSIPIKSKVGCSPIDIMHVFKHQSKILAKADSSKIILPPEVFIPEWEKRNELEATVIESALVNGDTNLVRGRQVSSVHERISYLVCAKGMCHQRSSTNKENMIGEIPHYKPGVKTDVIVNKSSSTRGPQGKAEPRRTKTTKPLDNTLCAFTVQLRLKEGQYWYLKYETREKGQHNHMRIPYKEQHRRMNTRPLQEREQASLFSQLTHAGSAQALSQSITGTMAPTRNQLYYNQRVQEGNLGKISQAQELIQYLQQQVVLQQKRYVALFHEVTDTTLLAITKYDLRRVALSLSLEAQNDLGEIETRDISLTTTRDKNGLGEALHSIRDNLTVGKKVLLAVAWSREDERKLFSKFPEVMMIDVTMGTNSQGLPEAVICCPGPDMKIYTPVRAFLPSQCQWVFGWIWGTAIPILLGRDKLQRTQLVLSDGDCKI